MQGALLRGQPMSRLCGGLHVQVAYQGPLEGPKQGYACSWTVGSDSYQGIGVRTEHEGVEYLSVGWVLAPSPPRETRRMGVP